MAVLAWLAATAAEAMRAIGELGAPPYVPLRCALEASISLRSLVWYPKRGEKIWGSAVEVGGRRRKGKVYGEVPENLRVLMLMYVLFPNRVRWQRGWMRK